MIPTIIKNTANILTYGGLLTWSTGEWLITDQAYITHCLLATFCGLMISNSVMSVKNKLREYRKNKKQ